MVNHLGQTALSNCLIRRAFAHQEDVVRRTYCFEQRPLMHVDAVAQHNRQERLDDLQLALVICPLNKGIADSVGDEISQCSLRRRRRQGSCICFRGSRIGGGRVFGKERVGDQFAYAIHRRDHNRRATGCASKPERFKNCLGIEDRLGISCDAPSATAGTS